MIFKFPPCTAAFAPLAASPLTNSVIGRLGAINEHGVNLVLGNQEFSAPALAALQPLDVIKLAHTHGRQPYADTQKFTGIGGGGNISPNDLYATVGPILERILPPHPGNAAVAKDLSAMLGSVSQAYDNAPLDFSFIANLPGSMGVFHHDNFTGHRWLVTLPTRNAPGTWVLDDLARDRKLMLPFADPLCGTNAGPDHNNYGRPTDEWNHLIREAPTGRLLGWHGDLSPTPRLHSEPDVLADDQARLTVIIAPTAMRQREMQHHMVHQNMRMGLS